MLTVAEARNFAAQLDSDSAVLDTDLLLCHASGKNRAFLYSHPEAELGDDARTLFLELFTRRQQGEPVAYILGQAEFWSLPFTVSPATLIPRPETECLIETLLALQPAGHRLLDLGTGTGAIAAALASELPRWRITAVDRIEEAVTLARANVQQLGLHNVEVLQSDWFSALGGRHFDVIVSNPPYIAAADPHLTQGDVRFEPGSALVSGPDGLDDIRLIVAQACQHLLPGGLLMLEHGYDQAEAVKTILQQAAYRDITLVMDYAGQPRISYAWYGSVEHG